MLGLSNYKLSLSCCFSLAHSHSINHTRLQNAKWLWRQRVLILVHFFLKLAQLDGTHRSSSFNRYSSIIFIIFLQPLWIPSFSFNQTEPFDWLFYWFSIEKKAVESDKNYIIAFLLIVIGCIAKTNWNTNIVFSAYRAIECPSTLNLTALHASHH